LETLMKMGKYKESEPYLRKLVRISNDKVYKTNLGNLYFRSGRIDKAMEVYQEVLKEDPKFYNALNNLARCYMEKGDYEKARELLEKAIDVDQDKKAAKVNYYFLLTAMGMDEEALGRELGAMRRQGKIPRWIRDYSELREWAASLLKFYGETFSHKSTGKK